MMKCKQCGKDLGYFNENGYIVFDVDFQRVGSFCQEHGINVENSLKEKRFVEEYKGNKIYSKDGVFFPYWGCQYFFDNLKDTKVRIDNSHIAIINKNAFKFING